MSVKATQLRRSLLRAYGDYASRNWPMWWSLELGMPLCYALAIALLTSIIGSMVDVRVPTMDPQSVAGCLKPCFNSASCSTTCFLFTSTLGEARGVISWLTAAPLVIGTLFSFLWFFYIARSFKFTNAPLLGGQPSVLPLALIGCSLLWTGLVGLKVLQWKNFSTGVLDLASFGSLDPKASGVDYSWLLQGISVKAKLEGEGGALIGLMISSIFIFFGAVFLVLYRQIGIGAALSGPVFTILSAGLGSVIFSILPIGISPDYLPILVLVVPLSIPPLIGLYALCFGHRVRRLSQLGVSTLLYLVSFGPMWGYLSVGIKQIPWASEFLKHNQVLWYPLCFGASVIACEVLARLLYRNRLRPAA